jgi:hypothetical protein
VSEPEDDFLGAIEMPRSTGAAFLPMPPLVEAARGCERGDAEHKMRAFVKRFLMH